MYLWVKREGTVYSAGLRQRNLSPRKEKREVKRTGAGTLGRTRGERSDRW